MLHNGLNTMQSIVDHYDDDINSFVKQLKNDNKNWSTHNTVMLRSYYTPIVMSRLVGILHYMNSGVNILHVIPDIHSITAARATNYNKLCNSLQTSEADEEADKVVVPPFSEVKGWMSFKENFLLLLGLT